MDCTQVSPNKHVNAAADYLQLEKAVKWILKSSSVHLTQPIKPRPGFVTDRRLEDLVERVLLRLHVTFNLQLRALC
jgi:hypothetical protein